MSALAELPGFFVVSLLLLLCAAGGPAWVAPRGRPVALAALVACLAGRVVIGPNLPAGLVTSVREGWSEMSLRMLLGQSGQAGPLLGGLWEPIFLPPRPWLRDVVATNVGLTGAAAVVWWAVWRSVAGGAVASLLTAVFLLHPAGLSAACSGQEAPTTALLLGLAAAAFLMDDRRMLASLAACLLLIPLSRVELAAPVLGGLSCRVLLLTERARGWEGRWTGWVDRATRWAPWPIAVAALVGVWAWVGEEVVGLPGVDFSQAGQLGYALAALNPFNDRVLTAVPVLLSLLPLGAVLAAGRGFGEAVRQPLRHGLIVLTLPVVYGAWFVAAHGVMHGGWCPPSPWELFRYVEMAVPLVLLLAARGLALLRPPTRWVFIGLMLLPPMTGAMRMIGPEHADQEHGLDLPVFGLVNQDPQRERHLLVQRIDEQPRCAILSRGLPWGQATGPRRLKWYAVLPAGPGLRWRPLEDPDASMEQAMGLLQGAPCAVAWRSLDCNLPGEDCAWADGLAPLLEATWEHRPFVHRDHGVAWEGEIHVGFYALPGWAADASARPVAP